MIRIKPETVYALRDSTGRALTELMDELIRHSVSVSGVAQAFVSTNLRVNYQDGGVDTQVALPLPVDKRGYFGHKSVWQYKAHEEKTLKKKKLVDEITAPSKTYLKELLQQGYAYRICIADNGPAKRKEQLETWADEAIQKIAPGAPSCKVLFADDIVAWVNSFPAIAARLSGADLADFFHFEAWTRIARHTTPTFVPTPESDAILKLVQNHVQWTTKPTTARLTVSGDAGVGKTRTVFEAIAALPEIAPLVVYVADEVKALEQATAAANDGEQYVVIVADECLDRTASQLESLLQGSVHRVRVVTIDNALERMDATDLRLERVTLTTLEKIVEANFPHIDLDRRYRYCHLADGSLRFAITLCQNDALMQQEGNLGEALRDATHYLNRYFGSGGPFEDADRTALEIISLVERCGVFGAVFSELESLCSLAHADAAAVRDRLAKMQKANGLVGRAGRYLYVTPAPIAMSCFHRAWERWIAPDPKFNLERFPKDLQASFLARLQRAPEGVGKVVNDYFRNWIISRGSDIFRSDDDTEQLLFLVRSYPDQMISRLEQLVATATAEQLAPGYGGGRRRLVVELTEIASFPQWFVQAESMLFRLAVDDPEPNLGNNATKLWCQLFPIIAPVATSFPDRFALVSAHAASENPKERLLSVLALSEVLHDSSIRLMNPGTYGNRVAPRAWRPQSWEEYFDYIRTAIGLLATLSSDAETDIRDKAARILVSSVRSLIFRGILGPAKEGASAMPEAVRPVLRAELREFLLLINSEHSQHSDEDKRRISEFVENWVAELAPSTLHDELVEELGPDSWEHNLEQAEWDARIRRLALRLVRDDEEFRTELPWLTSPAAKSAVEFGTQIGRFDDGAVYLDLIGSACIHARNPNLARGYFVGLAEMSRHLPAAEQASEIRLRANEAVDRMWQSDPVLAFYAMSPAGDFLNAFDRAIRAVRERQLPAGFLQTFQAWNGPVPTTGVQARLATETLLQASRDGDKQAATLGIEFIVHLLLRNKPENKTAYLQAVYSDDRLDTIFSLFEETARISDKVSAYFGQIFTHALPADPPRGIEVVVKMLDRDSYEISEVGSGLIHAVAQVDPHTLMEKIGELLLSEGSSLKFFLKRFPLLSIPADVLTDWVDRHGLEGARLVARYLTRPFIGDRGPDLHPVTKYVLERFGDDERVFASWVSGMTHGQAFAGSVADWVEKRAEQAEPFLTYPLSAVRRWAEGEILFASNNADDFRQREEEAY
jgi:hypothetical protein